MITNLRARVWEREREPDPAQEIRRRGDQHRHVEGCREGALPTVVGGIDIARPLFIAKVVGLVYVLGRCIL